MAYLAMETPLRAEGVGFYFGKATRPSQLCHGVQLAPMLTMVLLLYNTTVDHAAGIVWPARS